MQRISRVAFTGIFALLVLLVVAGCGGSTGDDNDNDNDASVFDAGPADAEVDGGTTTWVGAVGEVTFVGPWGGAATAVVEDPTQPGRLFAIVGDRPFRSTDDGGTWERVTNPPNGRALSLVALPDGRVVMGTDFDILVSADQGDSWQDISYNIEVGLGFGIMAYGLAYETGSATRLWAGLNYYATAPVWYLEEGETTWQPWNAPAGWDTNPLNGEARFMSVDVRLDPGSGETFVFASYEQSFGSGGGVFCSTDSAATWDDCSGTLPTVPYSRVRIYDDLVVVTGGQVFGSAYAGIYYSTDAGASWTASVSGWPNPAGNDFIRLPGGEFVVATYGRGLLRSTDLTGAWSPFPGYDGMEVHTLLALGSGDILAAPEQLGFARNANDGGPWTGSSTGLDLAAPGNVSVDPADASSLLAAMSSLNSGLTLHTTTGLDGWEVVDTLPFPRYSLVHISESGRWYVVSDGPTGQANDGIYVSEDAGGIWDFLGPLQGGPMDHDIIAVHELGDPQHLVTAGQYWSGGDRRAFIMESTDGGATWDELWHGSENRAAVAFVVAPNGDYLVAVAQESIVRVSPTGDASETLVIPGVVDGQVLALAGCQAAADTLLAVGRTNGATFDNDAFYTDDGGESWSTLDFGAEAGEQPRHVALHPYDCRLLLLATSNGRLVSSADAGLSWSDVDLGVPLGITGLRVVPLAASHDAVLLVYGVGGAVTVRLTTTPAGE
jgi:photosystem II stability/assembly factor-like uncharacterized protein